MPYLLACRCEAAASELDWRPALRMGAVTQALSGYSCARLGCSHTAQGPGSEGLCHPAHVALRSERCALMWSAAAGPQSLDPAAEGQGW